MTTDRLTAREEDAIKETFHLASAQGASMVARLSGSTVLVDVPQLLVGTRQQVATLLGGRDVRVVATTFGIQGELRGQVWWVLKADSAHRLGRHLAAKPMTVPWSEQAALAEAANLVASAVLSAVGTMIQVTLLPTTPEVFHVFVEDLVAGGDDVSTVLVAGFVSAKTPSFSGWLVLLLDEVSRDEVLRRLGL